MIGKTNLGGSGGGLNFKVVGGTSAPAGHENLVWVNTDTTIASWVVTPNQPETATDGMVWIQDGDTNGINIVKKNAVEVFPSGCQQYVNGGFETVEAYLFHNGAWTQFSFVDSYLFNRGDECRHLTGGWQQVPTLYEYAANTNRYNRGIAEIVSGQMRVGGGQSGTTYLLGNLSTVKKIDLSPFSVLTATGSSPSGEPAGLRIHRDLSGNIDVNRIAYVGIRSTTKTTVTLDISSINEPAYISFGISGPPTRLAYCESILLE